MTDTTGGSPFGITRRTMLKATAATTAGAALFSGSAAATEPEQINWCGCSQVCLEEGAGGSYLVILATEANGGWEFEAVPETKVQENSPKGFCNDDGESGEYKIIAVVPVRNDRDDNSNEILYDVVPDGKVINYYPNPGQCAQAALGELEGEINIKEPVMGYTSLDTDNLTKGSDAIYVNGRCGEPGKGDPEDPPRDPPEEPPRGPPE